ncbi:hypothetical protein BGX27_004207 [Mortierella sp. AM989]|nr:hypothetical protein BGX27_004207 [Mortierella sp. AM989]
MPSVPMSALGQVVDLNSASLTGGTIVEKVPLDQALDFNPAKGIMSRACVGCFEAYEQWQGLIPSGRNLCSSNSSNFSTQDMNGSSNNQASSGHSGASGTAPNTRATAHKPNTGYLPDGYLGGDNSREGIGREGQQQPDASTTHAELAKAAQELDKFLQERPAPEELVEKNILKDPKVAPSLQQHAEELKKAQLEDALNSKLEHRPPISELVDHNIIHEPHVAPSLQKQAEELKRSQLEDSLAHKIVSRPTPSELIEHNILHESKVYPEHQRKEEELKRIQLEKDLNAKLENRPSQDTLLEKHILV